MPMYDFQCEAGHRFESVVPIATRTEPIPCQDPACRLMARRVEICHARPSMLLDYGLGANRDAAREGRYDPSRPSKRGVRKVQL
jgi:hypothetical protein